MRKDTTILLQPLFKNPKTIPLIFHFEPESNGEQEGFKSSSVQCISIEGKEIYLIDHFFQPQEIREMCDFSKKTSFSRTIFGSPEAIEKGEKPAKAMNSKEKWEFFNHPPRPIRKFYKLLSSLSLQLDADIATLPWELCHDTTSSPAVATNFLEEVSLSNTELGKHLDYHPEEGIPFGIPILYEEEKSFHEPIFVNGACGKPWLVSAMIYSTAENFLPVYGMGTTFYKKNGELAFSSECRPLRIVLFEGDIPHSIEPSEIPPGITTWRVSYVFKLSINPRQKERSMKKAFSKLVL